MPPCRLAVPSQQRGQVHAQQATLADPDPPVDDQRVDLSGMAEHQPVDRIVGSVAVG